MNGSGHAASVHATDCVILHSNLLHMVEVVKISDGTSPKSMKMCSKKNSQKVGLYIVTIDG
jgi:hypothetical protein